MGLSIPPGFFTYGAGAAVISTGTLWLRARIETWKTGKQVEQDHLRRQDDFQERIEKAALEAGEKIISVYRQELEKAQALLAENRAHGEAKDEAFIKSLNGIDASMEKLVATVERESQARMANDHALQQTLQAMDGRLRLLEDRSIRP